MPCVNVFRLVLFLILLPMFVVAQNRNISVRVGDYLTADDAAAALWLSNSGDFAFGFRQLDGEEVHFLLAIWFNKIPDKTIVWYANGDNPVPRGSKVELTPDRGLALSNPQGEEIWRSQFTRGAIAYGIILDDTGNLLLVDENSDNLWESFKYPTDTLLPTQIMERGGVLSSRQRNNFSQGRFQFRLLPHGNAMLNPINMLSRYNDGGAYYISETSDSANDSNSGYRVIFHDSGYLYVERKSGERYYITQEYYAKDAATSCYHKATLNFDGVFTISQHPKNPTANDRWTVIRSIPNNICLDLETGMGSGPCGNNSICSIGDDRRPSCHCPPGFSLTGNDQYGTCEPDYIQGCEDDGKTPQEAASYNLVELQNTDWPSNEGDSFRIYDLENCKASCLQDCHCPAVEYKDNKCWKKLLPLNNGRHDREIKVTVFLKVRKNQREHQVPEATKDQGTLIIEVSVLLGTSVFVNLLFVGTFCLGILYYYKKQRKRISHLDDGVVEMNLRQFTYKEMMEATNGFKEELGRGSCGIVYRGEVENGAIAVKRLDRVFEDSDKEFKTEVNVIGKTHHKNLVRLLGYCAEGQHRMLVYEFLRNGTLASFLFGDFKPSWTQRINIAIEVAKGLIYLHEECSSQIIHCDIKPQNILLDEYYGARISDFGLAKLLLMNQSKTKTNIRGTKGYVAPEWFRTSPVTVKVDVYSFGVLLLEIICCRRNVDMEAGGERGILTDWAYDCYQQGRLDLLVEDDREALNDMKKLDRFVIVAIWCLQENPHLRPSMKKVMLMLEGIVQVFVPPSPCPFSSIS